jgi:hypothetical protein
MSLETEDRLSQSLILTISWFTKKRVDPIEPDMKMTKTRALSALVDQVALSRWPWVGSAPRDSSWAASSSVSSPASLS